MEINRKVTHWKGCTGTRSRHCKVVHLIQARSDRRLCNSYFLLPFQPVLHLDLCGCAGRATRTLSRGRYECSDVREKNVVSVEGECNNDLSGPALLLLVLPDPPADLRQL